MSASIREKVILLKKTKYGEADLIVQALSAKEGKISFLARGALRSKKRFGGGILEPTHHIEAQFQRPTNSERLCTLQDAILINDFAQIRNSYERIEAALKIVEVAARVSQPGDPHAESVYNLIGSALKVLASQAELLPFRMHFALRFLRLQGVLEEEPWMAPYLQTPMGENKKVETTPIDTVKLHWIETLLNNYIEGSSL